MIVSTNKRLIRVVMEQGASGLFYASSPDVNGFMISDATEDDLRRAIPGALRDLHDAADKTYVRRRKAAAVRATKAA